MTDDELITVFMGGSVNDNHPEDRGIKFPVGDWTNIKKVKYGSDWNWIMSVVMKINKIHEYTEIDGDEFLEGERQIQVMKLGAGNANFESVRNAIVNFIKWYNLQKNRYVDCFKGRIKHIQV